MTTKCSLFFNDYVLLKTAGARLCKVLHQSKDFTLHNTDFPKLSFLWNRY